MTLPEKKEGEREREREHGRGEEGEETENCGENTEKSEITGLGKHSAYVVPLLWPPNFSFIQILKYICERSEKL